MLETEIDIAKKIAAGEIKGPYRFLNMILFAVRITGTGTAYRKKEDSFVYRPPQLYLNDQFVERCLGLPVIIEHPENDLLDNDEYIQRNIGSIMYAYRLDELGEIWGIVRTYDESIIEILETEELSTSPTVFFKNADDNEVIYINGEKLLIEGEPVLIDHLALCVRGVWDKAGQSIGVLTDRGNKDMNEEELAALEAAKKAAKKGQVKADNEGADSNHQILEMLQNIAGIVNSIADRVSVLENKGSKTMSDEEKAAKEEAEKAAAMEEERQATIKADAEERAAIKSRIANIEKNLPKELTQEEQTALYDAQAKADSVYAAFGDSAPRPLNGESVLAYRQRLANKLKTHSKTYKDINLTAISDAKLFGIAESAIYSDAMEAASHPVVDQKEGLRKIVRRDETGRNIITFAGHPSAWTNQFKAPARRLVQINKQ